jgi:hypothetical protein
MENVETLDIRMLVVIEHTPCSTPTATLLNALMMEAASTSENSAQYYETSRCNVPEDGHFHTHHREMLKI